MKMAAEMITMAARCEEPGGHALEREYRFRLAGGRTLGCLALGDPADSPVLYFHGYPGSRIEGRLAAGAVAFPVAAGVFYPFVISPEAAALAMSGSSALVAANALLLKRTRLAGIHGTRGASAHNAMDETRPVRETRWN